MFRSLAQVSRAVASTSSQAQLHTSAVLNGLSYKARRAVKQERREHELEIRPSPILGYRSGNENLWIESDLARILVDESELEVPGTTASIPPLSSTVSYGIKNDEDKNLLLRELPELSAQRDYQAQSLVEPNMSPGKAYELLTAGQAVQTSKSALFARAIDLRNANADGIHFENRQRIIREFSTPANPFNPGLTEVQAALYTYRIRCMHKHVSARQHKKDVAAKPNLRMLVYHRARMLKYLKRTDRVRYDILLPRLGLERGAVEGELMV